MNLNTTLLPAGNPFGTLRRDFERKLGTENGYVFAAMTVTESPNAFVVHMDLPGVAISDVDITLHKDELVIEGGRKQEIQEGFRSTFCDRSFSHFRRVLKLREPVDKENLDAELQNGVLTLQLPRIPISQPQKISIRLT